MTLTYIIYRVQQKGIYDKHDERISIWFKNRERIKKQKKGQKGGGSKNENPNGGPDDPNTLTISKVCFADYINAFRIKIGYVLVELGLMK